MRDFQLVDRTDLSSPRKQKRVSIEHLNKTRENTMINNKQNDIMQINKMNIANDLEKLEEKYLEIKNNKCYNDVNRIFYSKNCIFYYIFTLLISILIFAYALLGFFLNINEKLIYSINILFVWITAIDMFMRLYLNGFHEYFSRSTNLLDPILILFTMGSIIFFIINEKQFKPKIENLTIIFVVLIRNLIQLIRLMNLMKNQQTVKKNIEEIINFTGVVSERKFEMIPNLKNDNKTKNQPLSFVGIEITRKNEKDQNLKIVENLKDNEVLPENDN